VGDLLAIKIRRTEDYIAKRPRRANADGSMLAADENRRAGDADG